MEDSDILGKRLSRRDLFKVSIGAVVGSAVTIATQKINAITSTNNNLSSPDQLLPQAVPAVESAPLAEKQEQTSQTELALYGDLTPGIGISVAWVGTYAMGRPLIENIIAATKSVGIAPYIFVPHHMETDFNEFAKKHDIGSNAYHLISCDPEYKLHDDSVEISTGKITESPTKKGFISPWIRDWGTMIGVKANNLVELKTRKKDLPDPLRGVEGIKKMTTVDPGLKFDGGAYFYFQTENGIPICIVSENEIVNNNTYNFPKGVDPKEEAIKRLKETFGQKIEIILLPSLKGSSVDHIDIQELPVGDNMIVVGEAFEDDNNYPILNEAAATLSSKGLEVARVPIRRIDDNIVSWTNGLPHITKGGEKIMFMSVYDGYDAENKMAQEMYKKLGFEVVLVNATSTIKTGGSVHCATNTSMTAALIDSL